MENYCTVYAHEPAFNKIVAAIEKACPKGKIDISEEEGTKTIVTTIKGGFFGGKKEFQVSYRERAIPSYEITIIDSPLTQNLSGMMSFVNTLQSRHEQVKKQLIHKISTLNCEFAVLTDGGMEQQLKPFVQAIAHDLDAIIFARPETSISQSSVQHFLDRDLNLILDANGDSQLKTLDVKINSKYFDQAQDQLKEDQLLRKEQNENIITSRGMKVNPHLPCIPSEGAVKVRDAKTVAERVVMLAVTNLVAFNSISGEQAFEYLNNYNLSDKLTPKETDFLKDPTEEKKSYETWKCEGIWTLMWGLNMVPNLGFPSELADLKNIPAETYPVRPDADPNVFINKTHMIRSSMEILNVNDLYYRMHWACVDARVKGEEMTAVHPGVVYERHYALNWLIHYRDQEWDEVSCDT